MTIRQLFGLVDELKPNNFSVSAKLYMLNCLEGKIAADIMLMAPSELSQFYYTEEDMDKELLAEAPHEDVYVLWLKCQIDFENGDYDKFQNGLILYNTAIDNFSTWFADEFNPGASDPNVPQYCISAYSLAVKQGFNGSLDEWLKSLVGKTAYEIAVENGYTGTVEEWLQLYEGAAERAEKAAATAKKAKAQAELSCKSAGNAAVAATNAKDRAEQILIELNPDTFRFGTKNIEDLSVTTPKLAGGAVTAEKLADGAVSGAKIASGAVSGDKLQKLCVSGDKIMPGAVGESKIAPEAVTLSKLSNEVKTAFAPAYTSGTADLTPNSSPLESGKLYIMYE